MPKRKQNPYSDIRTYNKNRDVKHEKKEDHIATQDTFDYIVIGAGTAGGVIAKELSDDRSTSVLALEPGTNMREQFK